MDTENQMDHPPATQAPKPVTPAKNKGGRPPNPALSVAEISRIAAEAAVAAIEQVSQRSAAAAVELVLARLREAPMAEPARVVPPRVGATHAARVAGGEQIDEAEDYDPLDPRVQREAKRRLRGEGAEVPRAQGLTDAEVLEMFQGEELGEFDVPKELIPDGMVYGWWTREVVGKENRQKDADLARRGWRAVDHERHPGMWGMPGSTGPIMHKGLMLMEVPVEQHQLRERYQRLLAKQAVRDKIAQMSAAPPGTGPRDNPKLNNKVSRVFEPLPIE